MMLYLSKADAKVQSFFFRASIFEKKFKKIFRASKFTPRNPLLSGIYNASLFPRAAFHEKSCFPA